MLNILSLCGEPEILTVLKLVNTVLGIIRVVVPITLIVSLSLTYLSAVASKNDDLVSAAIRQSVTKMLAAILVFFVPTFAAVIFNVASGDDTYKTCLANATTENIEKAYDMRASDLISRAKDNMQYYTYMEALRAVRNVSDGNKKAQYEEELKDIKYILDVKDLIAKVARTKKNSDYEKAAEAIEGIKDPAIKQDLENELESIAASMNSYYGEYSSPGSVANALGLPYYAQCDPRWGGLRYDIGGGSNGGPATFCSSSCGYTSLSMIVAGMSRDMTITPVTMVEGLRGINIASGGMTSRGYGAASQGELTNNNFLSKYGIRARTLGVGSYDTTAQSILGALNANQGVIILVPGHYMTLAKGTNGGVVLLDPYIGWADGRKKSGEYSLDFIAQVYGGIEWAAAYSH